MGELSLGRKWRVRPSAHDPNSGERSVVAESRPPAAAANFDSGFRGEEHDELDSLSVPTAPPADDLPGDDAAGDVSTIAEGKISDSYWQQARRPLTALLFVLPLLTVYECGVLWLGPEAMRNGADVWLRQLLDAIGFGQYFLLPALTVAILLGWHHTTHQPWKVSPSVLYGMLAECVVLACGMVVLAQIQGAILQAIISPRVNFSLTAAIGSDQPGTLARVVSFSGAGIYEEVLFRLALLPLASAVLIAAGSSKRVGKIGAVVITSLIFSAAHYLGPLGQTFELYSFGFRFLAGALFSLLFVYRGFGIAAGTHTAYDIFVGVF